MVFSVEPAAPVRGGTGDSLSFGALGAAGLAFVALGAAGLAFVAPGAAGTELAHEVNSRVVMMQRNPDIGAGKLLG
jgi:hypothetical protein